MKRFFAFALTLMMLTSLLPSALADGPHTHVWKEVSRMDPTCTLGGYVTHSCACGARKTESLHALGHEWATKVYTGHADCIHYGVFYWVCARCGAHSDTGNDAPLGHDWDGGVITKEPTGTEEGEVTYTCLRDPSHTKTETLPAKDKNGGKTYSTLKIVWDDEDDKAGLRPSEVRADFIRHPSGKDKEITQVTLTGGNGWTYTVTDLPCFDGSGAGITYSWSEHTEELPEVYKLTGIENDGSLTVFTNMYSAGLTDPKPSLTLAVEAGSPYSFSTIYDGEWEYTRVNTAETVTNTGNIPLTVNSRFWFNGDTGKVKTYYNPACLKAAETQVFERSYDVEEIFYSWDSILDDIYDSYLIETPEDPLHSAYAVISVVYDGYDANTKAKDMSVKDAIDAGSALCHSNECTFTVYIPREDAVGEPLGIKAMKTEAHAPANGEYYELGETIDYVITLTNETGSDVFNVAVYDSLAGFEPIASVGSFAQGGTLQFSYSTVVTDDEIAKDTAVNGAVIMFDYGNEVNATPRFSNHVHSKAGNTEAPETVRFDKTKLEAVPEYPSEEGTAEYLIAEAEKLYALLWEAGDDTAKCAVLEERAMFLSYLEAVNGGMSEETVSFRKLRAEALFGRLAFLAGADETEFSAAPEGLTGSELIAETLRLKCLSLCKLINAVK
ncbi:MAG: Cna B-type domain-containing protein [Clostridia bacterium]|nr:Cna B-type domain-containing protein [Clostridia bacterium]